MLNAVEILPCAERPSLHMGAHTLKIDILGITPESHGKEGDARDIVLGRLAPDGLGLGLNPRDGSIVKLACFILQLLRKLS